MDTLNIVATGLYNAQLAFKTKSISPNRKTTMFEIELPTEAGGVSYINDEARPVTEHTVICAKPGQIRHTRLPFKCHYIHMIVGEGLLYQTLTALPNFIEVTDTERLREIFLSIQHYAGTGFPEDTLMLHSLVTELVYLLHKCAAPVAARYRPKANNRAVIEQTLDYIRHNLTADLSLEALAAVANFSPIYFHKLFKASTGQTLNEYIKEQRIKKSITLLLSTNMTMTRIAYECGFSSQSYFSYAFKKKMKLSPHEYAKRLIDSYGE